MPLEVQTVAGAVEFTGVAGAGLFTFADLALFTAVNYRPIVNRIAVVNEGAAPRVQIFQALAATAAAQRELVVDEVGNNVIFLCRHIIPKDASNLPFQVFVITTGKTADGRAEVDWEIGRIDGA